MGSSADGPVEPGEEPASLELAYAELNHMLLQGLEVEPFLKRLGELASSLVPGVRCVVSVRRSHLVQMAIDLGALTAGPDDVGVPVQRLPCLDDPRLDDVEEHGPAGAEPARARGHGPGGGEPALTLPLVVQGTEIGSLRLFVDSSARLSDAATERLQRFSGHAAPALMLLLRHSADLHLHDQLQEAVATRAVIDQALGVLMHARKISSHQAFEALRHASQTSNRKLSAIAAELVESLTGHPPEPPRPLSPSRRRHAAGEAS